MHASIAGAPADEVIQALIAQFSDPFAFVRELIQNSLDAGARRIDVRVRWSDGVLVIEVADDGEGMDRATIEGYLLVKFRSSKERDLTKIGKFGIGFVSLFAMAPFEVVVDTGRDGVWHRVVFAADTSWTLHELEEPFEGTTVSLRMRRSASEAGVAARRVSEAARRWCRYADGEVWVSAEGVPGAWAPAPIREAWGVDAPLEVRHEADGVRVVAGPSSAGAPPIGYYNRGLTLWEGAGDTPGVTWRAEGRHLEHTLTRDNVVRDHHLDVVHAAVRRLVRGPLGEAVHAALVEREGQALDALLAALHPSPPWAWSYEVAFLPTVGGGRVSLSDLRGGVLDRVQKRSLWCCASSGFLAQRLGAAGVAVLRGAPTDPGPRLAAAILGRAVRDVAEAWVAAEPVEGDEEQRRVAAAIGERVGTVRLALLRGPLAVELGEDGAPRPVDDPRGGTVFLGVDHPLMGSLVRLSSRLAGALGARAVEVVLGREGRLDDTVGALLDALGEEG